MEKTMLYFESMRKLPTDWKGIPIYDCAFIIVENGRRLNFRVTKAAREIKMLQLGSCYETVQDIEREYKVAWLKDGEIVKPLSVSFSIFQQRYIEEQEEKRRVAEEQKLALVKTKRKLFSFRFRESNI